MGKNIDCNGTDQLCELCIRRRSVLVMNNPRNHDAPIGYVEVQRDDTAELPNGYSNPFDTDEEAARWLSPAHAVCIDDAWYVPATDAAALLGDEAVEEEIGAHKHGLVDVATCAGDDEKAAESLAAVKAELGLNDDATDDEVITAIRQVRRARNALSSLVDMTTIYLNRALRGCDPKERVAIETDYQIDVADAIGSARG